MPAVGEAKLLEMVRRSGLVEPDDLESALARFQSQAENPAAGEEELGDYLVDQNLLTRWQCDHLHKGQYKGFTLGKYALLDILGQGGMARVYLGKHKLLKNRVAIKVLSKNRVAEGSVLDRFIAEAQMAAQINHPNIVRVFDVDSKGDFHYLVMEYVGGGSLQGLVDNQGPLPYRKAMELLLQAASGLAAAHDLDLVHRDIKPANLLIDKEKHVKVADFGLARMYAEDDASLTVQYDEKILGTADYIAPEQAVNSHNIDSRADQYALGATLYFMLTGRPPFPTGRIVERMVQHRTEEPEAIRGMRPDLPEGVHHVWYRLSRKDPDRRYASCDELCRVIENWLHRPVGQAASAVAVDLAKIAPAAVKSLSSPAANQPASPSHDDELLGLAEEESDEAIVDQTASTPAKNEASKSGQHRSDVEPSLEPMPDLLSEDAGLTDGDLAMVSTMLSDIADGDVLSELADGEGDQLPHQSGTTGLLDADDPLAIGSTATPSHVLMAPANQSAVAATESKSSKTSLADYRRQLKIGELPLWICIGLGILLGIALVVFSISYFSSFEGEAQPSKTHERSME